MRAPEKITLVLPTQIFKKIKAISPKQNHHVKEQDKELLFYIVSELIAFESIRKKQQFYNLKTEKIISIIGYKLNTYINILKSEEIILSDNIYEKGIKSKYYKLNNDLIDQDLSFFELNTKGHLHKKLTTLSYNQKKNYNRLDDHLIKMKDLFYSLEFDTEAALRWSKKHLKDNRYLSAVYSINSLRSSKTKYFKINKTNKRLDTNYTSLKSELRQFIKQDNLISIDLKNSQPLLLALLLNSINSSITINSTLCYKNSKFKPFKRFKNKQLSRILFLSHFGKKISENEEIINYLDVCLQGKFYDQLENTLEAKDRKKVKQLMFAVLFSRNTLENCSLIPHYESKSLFKQAYPFVYEASCILKDEVHNNLAIALQELESFIFIECIAKELCENGIIPLTIHDSLIIPNEQAEKALQLASKTFKSIFGVIPSFSIKSL